MLDWLRLVRISGLCTIASNLIAAALVAFYVQGGLDPVWLAARLVHECPRALWVLAASCLLFASGMMWNDLSDVARDRIINPKRPLPSGRIPLPLASVVAALTTIGSLLASAMAEPSGLGLWAGGVVLSLALLYDFAAKQVPWLGSLVMCLVRMAHAVFALLLLGPDYLRVALVAPGPPGLPSPLLYPAILGLYVFGLTLVSELEHRRSLRWELLVGGLVMAVALTCALVHLATASWIPTMLSGGGWRPLVAVAALTAALLAAVELVRTAGVAWWQALRGGSRARIGPVIGAGLGGMILLDAIIATGAHPLGVLLILPLYTVFRGLSRAIRMD